jgi:hypothetical protein
VIITNLVANLRYASDSWESTRHSCSHNLTRSGTLARDDIGPILGQRGSEGLRSIFNGGGDR